MTQTVLHIDASARSEGSLSRINSAALVKAQETQDPQNVIRRDLASGLPFLDETWVKATFMAPDERSAAETKALELSDTLVAEVQAADTIVIGMPMYNFSLPAVLKAWIDQITRTGVTFTYTEDGPKGLLEGKKVIISIATGGVPLGTAADFASDYLRFAFGFVGITDVTILDKDGEIQVAEAA